MVDIESMQDASTGILVLVIVSLVIALAWESTHVRDHRVIATAVLVLRQETRQQAPEDQSSSVTEIRRMDLPQGNDSDTGVTAGPSNEPVSVADKQNTEQNCDNNSVLKCNIDKSDSSNSVPEDNNMLLEKNQSRTITDEPNLKHDDISVTSTPLNGKSVTLESSEIEEPSGIDGSQLRHRNLVDSPSVYNSENLNSNERTSGNDRASSKSDNEQVLNGGVDKSQEVKENDNERPTGSIKIRLKFLDETQRVVYGLISDQIISFKRAHFAVEIDNHRVVRLIFNGRLLSRDNDTLGSCGLFDDCVVHCHVSQPRPPSTTNRQVPPGVPQEDNDLDLSELLVPSLFCILLVLWWVRFEYSHLFNMSATIIMVCLTLLLLISQYALTITLNISIGGSNARTNQSNADETSQSEEGNGEIDRTTSHDQINSQHTTNSSVTSR